MISFVDDPTALEWAAKENRILLTHDVSTITKECNLFQFFLPQRTRRRHGEHRDMLIETL